MCLREWNSGLETGHPLIDRQHKELILQVNGLYDAVMNGQGTAAVGPFLDALARYTSEHFRLEEQCMHQMGYAEYSSHKKLHDDLVQKLATVVAQNRAGKASVEVALIQFVGEWVGKHFLSDDKKMVQSVLKETAGLTLVLRGRLLRPFSVPVPRG